MGNYHIIINFEGSEFYSKPQDDSKEIYVETSIISSKRFKGYYESGKISFRLPFSGKKVSLELGLLNQGKSKAIKRIKRTVSSILESEERLNNFKKERSLYI